MRFFIKNKKKFCFLFLFLFLFFYGLWISPLTSNELWNYGFSYGIVKGEILYKDFNLVVGPFYPFLMAIPLFFSNSLVSYLLFHSFLTVCFMILLHKMYQERILILLLLGVMIPSLLSPSYNLFFIYLTILLVYLEKSELPRKDYWIGVVLACAFFTKQSSGLILLLPSLFCYSKNLWKRGIGFFSVTLYFLIYFLLTSSLGDAINYCFLGLFDFGEKNSSLQLFPFVLFCFLFIMTGILLWTRRREYHLFYYGIGMTLALPIIDFIHVSFALYFFVLLLFEVFSHSSFSFRKSWSVSVILIGVLLIEGIPVFTDFSFSNNFSHFQYRYFSSSERVQATHLLSYLKGKEFVIFSDQNYFYQIALDQKLNHLDIVNYGNNGYDGSERIMKEINLHKEMIYLLPKDINHSQIDKKGYLMIQNQAVKIDSIEGFDVYAFQ